MGAELRELTLDIQNNFARFMAAEIDLYALQDTVAKDRKTIALLAKLASLQHQIKDTK
jgi:hypothetical protein